MGITLTPMPAESAVIPKFRTEDPSFLSEGNDISFSEGCCTCCVGIIDMVNSTKVTAGLHRDQMSKYYCLFINWAAAVIRGYGGTVVKNTGDGLLFYFPSAEESENAKVIRQCLDCSIAMIRLHPNVNMKFRSEFLPELNYRISLDYGEVSLARTMDSTVLDIFSTTVNVCAKINNIAAPNTVVVGGDMFQVSKNLSGYGFRQTNRTLSIADRPYPVYSVSEASIFESKAILHHLTSMKHSHVSTRAQSADQSTHNEVKGV
jgi:class 3 adenylate cyclase